MGARGRRAGVLAWRPEFDDRAAWSGGEPGVAAEVAQPSDDARRDAETPLRPRDGESVGREADAVVTHGDDHLAADLLEVHARASAEAHRHARRTAEFAARHAEVPMTSFPVMPTDVHDLAGLRRIGDLVAGHESATA